MSETVLAHRSKFDGSMGGGEADEAVVGPQLPPGGPSETDPYALDWADYSEQILRAFAIFYPDSDGFDFGRDDVEKLTHAQLVELCTRIQQRCKKAIDRPWACELLQLFVDAEGSVPVELDTLPWSELDGVSLVTLAKAQESIQRRRSRESSQSPKKVRVGRSKVPEASKESDDEVPLSVKFNTGGKRAAASEPDDGYETPGAAVEALLQRKAKGKKVPPKAQHEELRRSPRKVEKGKKAAKQAEETEKALRAEVALMRRQQKEMQDRLKLLSGAPSKQSSSKAVRKKKRRAPSPSSSGEDEEESTESGESDSSDGDSDQDSSESSSSESSKQKKRKEKKTKKKVHKSSESRSSRHRKGRKTQRRGRSATRKDARGAAAKSIQYQYHVLANEVRGTKVEDAVTIHELFGAWGDLANVQAEVDSEPEAYAPAELPRRLSDAKRQVDQDFKLACKMMPDGWGKAELVASAERILINQMVQESRKSFLVKDFNLYKMATKAMEKVRDFTAKHTDRQGLRSGSPWQRTTEWQQPDQSKPWTAGKSGGKGGGKGKGKGNQAFNVGGRTCYNCQMTGHISYECPFPSGASQQWRWQQQQNPTPPAPPLQPQAPQ